MDSLVTLLTALTNVTKNSILDVVGVVDMPLSLSKEVFQRNLSVKLTGQLVTHVKTVRVAKSVICKKIFLKDVISNE